MNARLDKCLTMAFEPAWFLAGKAEGHPRLQAAILTPWMIVFGVGLAIDIITHPVKGV